jgi:hypothetical protein
MRHANSHADCQPISIGDSYVYAYPDSSGHSYTYRHALSDAYVHAGSRTDNNTLRVE